MSRLSPTLGSDARAALSATLASRIVGASRDAGLAPIIVTADAAVRRWCVEKGTHIGDDPGGGLSAAVAATVEAMPGIPWLVAHADLPAVDGEALAQVVDAAERVGTAIAPSLDGGTNVLASDGSFPFSYGPGSFHRHLASAPHACVVVDRRLAVEVDTPRHLVAITSIGLMPSLLP